jgi:ankyrin repeat protein
MQRLVSNNNNNNWFLNVDYLKTSNSKNWENFFENYIISRESFNNSFLINMLKDLKLERYLPYFLEAGYETDDDFETLSSEDFKSDVLSFLKIPHRKRMTIYILDKKRLRRVNTDTQETVNKVQEVKILPKISLDWESKAISYKPINKVTLNKKDKGLALSFCQQGDYTSLLELFKYNIFPEPVLNQCFKTASSGGNIEILKFLHGVGANDGEGALEAAIKSGTCISIRYLAKMFPNLDLKKSLQEALERKNRNVAFLITEILKKGPNGDIEDISFLNKSLLNACQTGQLDIAKSLIARGANDLDAGLASAASGGNIDIMKYLYEEGARDLNNALVMACKSGNKATVGLLIELGANNFSQALVFAEKRQDEEICYILKRAAL